MLGVHYMQKKQLGAETGKEASRRACTTAATRRSNVVSCTSELTKWSVVLCQDYLLDYLLTLQGCQMEQMPLRGLLLDIGGRSMSCRTLLHSLIDCGITLNR